MTLSWVPCALSAEQSRRRAAATHAVPPAARKATALHRERLAVAVYRSVRCACRARAIVIHACAAPRLAPAACRARVRAAPAVQAPVACRLPAARARAAPRAAPSCAWVPFRRKIILYSILLLRPPQAARGKAPLAYALQAQRAARPPGLDQPPAYDSARQAGGARPPRRSHLPSRLSSTAAALGTRTLAARTSSRSPLRRQNRDSRRRRPRSDLYRHLAGLGLQLGGRCEDGYDR